MKIIFYKNNFELIKNIFTIIKNNTDSIIHSHLTKADIICSIIKKIKFNKLKLVTTRPYDYNINKFSYFLYGNFYRYIGNFNFQITISKQILNLIKFNEKYKNNLNTKIINYAAEDKSNIRINQKKNFIKISIVGRLLKWKNHITIINHFNNPIFKNFIIVNKIKFYIYGTGPLYEFLQQSININKLSNYIKIFTNIENPDYIYYDTDILLHPSLSEGFGLVAIESMSFKIPVICNKNIGMSEIVKSISNQLVINVNSSDELIKSINFTLNNYDFIANKSYKLFLKKFSFKVMSQEYYKVYKYIYEK